MGRIDSLLAKKLVFFLINGFLFASITWALQYFIFLNFSHNHNLAYAASSGIAVSIMTILNFQIQQRYIFYNSGDFKKYIAVDFLVIVLLTFLSPIFRSIISVLFEQSYGDFLGFPVAAFFASVVSFLLKYLWVFTD